MVNLFEKKNNIIEWCATGDTINKVIAINKNQVLDIFHGAIDKSIKIEIRNIDEYLVDENLDFQVDIIDEILPIGTEKIKHLYSSQTSSVGLLDGEYIVAVSWDTDNVILI